MQYELLYIVSSSYTDEDVGKVEGNVKALIEKVGARLVEAKRLGKFKFAYPIRKQRHGHYVLAYVEMEPAAVAKLDEALRMSNDVLRHLILRADEAGGDKFDLVQFTEVNLDLKDDRPRRRREEATPDDKAKAAEDIKSGVAAIESTEAGVEKPAEEKPALSDEELDKKLAEALESDTKDA
ncbi:30S ribosomal protein S6 [Candidatus Uhrbacteria bacterium]|nr:30S ribosomal protein S6 [Candidatus Uhrbacteria bacterium]